MIDDSSDGQYGMTAEDEQLLQRLGHWLLEARRNGDGQTAFAADEELVEPVGMLQLAEQLAAARHEVKLLTKTLRSGEERGEAALLAMQAAVEQLRQVKPDGQASASSEDRTAVEILADLDDALHRGRRAMDAARQRAMHESFQQLQQIRAALDDLYRTQSWWRRILCRPWHRALKEIHSEQAISSNRRIFDGLLEGYDLIHNRLQRSLKEVQLLRIDCVGQQVDPHCMTVVEVVNDPSRPAGIVLEVVRAGYYWKGKVLRFAEVKAVSAS